MPQIVPVERFKSRFLKTACQALVFTWVIGRPVIGEHEMLMLTPTLTQDMSASSLSGMPMGFPALAWSGWTQARRCFKSTCDHSSLVTLRCRNPVARPKRAMCA